jgi:uncharacterized HAD superfamily protein
MRVAVDIDDVLFPSNSHLLRWHNERYGTSHAELDRTSFYLERVWGVSTEETIRRVGEFYDDVPLVPIPPIPGAREALDQLRLRHQLVVMTGRFRRHADLTTTWVETHFPKYFADIILTSFGDAEAVPKSTLCRRHGIALLIDDHLDNLAECARIGIAGVLYGQYPWNQATALPLIVHRAGDWTHVPRHVHKLLYGG